MGAGYCQWGGPTNRNICNIYGGVHLASRYRAMLRPWTFVKFGIMPKIMSAGPPAVAGGSVTHTRMEGRKES